MRHVLSALPRRFVVVVAPPKLVGETFNQSLWLCERVAIAVASISAERMEDHAGCAATGLQSNCNRGIMSSRPAVIVMPPRLEMLLCLMFLHAQLFLFVSVDFSESEKVPLNSTPQMSGSTFLSFLSLQYSFVFTMAPTIKLE